MPQQIEMCERACLALMNAPGKFVFALREAAFCVSHAVHHLALARAGGKQPGGGGWGPARIRVAASTLRPRGAA